MRDGVLTCAWHNWKFELGTGACRYVASPKRERFVFQSSSERTSMTLA